MKDQEKDSLYESDTAICTEKGVVVSSPVQVKRAFERCYYSIPLEFKGKIQKKNNKYVCFEKIYISGMYSDGTMYDDKEDHVWMELTGFEQYHVGDAVSFGAEVYRYIKTSHGKSLDYGLRNQQGIRKIESYDLPSDEELRTQALKALRCEMCDMADFCNHTFCYRRG
ncbi:MAG: hypothetical protein UEY91_01815 [Lachnospiraceae bacterium]|nr:hypothetical protein [Lachnospiraceae bacterium]